MKYEIIHFSISERELFENYLNEKAKNGFHLQWIGKYIICFKKEDKSLHYLVDISSEVDTRQQEMYEEFGCNLICENKIFKIYTSKNQSFAHTDFEVERKVIYKKENIWFKEEIIFPTIMLIYLFFRDFSFDNMMITLSSNGFLFITLAVVLTYLEKLLEFIVKPDDTKKRTQIQLVFEIVELLTFELGIYMISNIQFAILYLLFYGILWAYKYSTLVSKEKNIKLRIILVVGYALSTLILGGIGVKEMFKGENPELISNDLISSEVEFKNGIDNNSIFLEYKVASFDTKEGYFKYKYLNPKLDLISNMINKNIVDQFNYKYSINDVNVYYNQSSSVVVLKKENTIIQLYTNYDVVPKEYVEKTMDEIKW